MVFDGLKTLTGIKLAKDNNTQSTLIRGFMIAEKIVQAERPLSSAYLAEELGLPKATVHRIACQLEEEGMLQREPDGKRFTGGKRLRYLAISTLSNSVITAGRHAILQTLSEEINETCNLATLDGDQIIYLDRVESNWPYRIHLPIGSHLPLHCTATGKLFLSNMTSKNRHRLLMSLPLKQFTDKTITDVNELDIQLKQIAEDGVSHDIGEYLEGMVAIAVPVIGENNQICFAIAIHAPSTRRSVSELRQYLPVLRHAAARMAESECDSR